MGMIPLAVEIVLIGFIQLNHIEIINDISPLPLTAAFIP